MLSILALWLLLGISLLQPKQRQFLTQKPWQDWILDGLGLCVEGGLIPLVQIFLSLQIYHTFFPSLKGSLELPGWVGFSLSFVGLDYLYYWNHRLLHHKLLFPIHAVHHTLSQMDMLGTARNTLWSSFFIVYLWGNSLMFYLLQDPKGYAWGVFLTYLLDLWRHSSLHLPPTSQLFPWLNPWLILPKDHASHHAYDHSQNNPITNFGANLKIWDRLHQTYGETNVDPVPLGIVLRINLTQKLLWPFPKKTQA